MNQRFAVLDFETTGLSPAAGDRATEIAIVVMEGEREVDRFQSLMNAGVRLSSFIEDYTGITNEMVAAAPPAAGVMAQARGFGGDTPLVAHNASFDSRFWAAELARLGPDESEAPAFACTLLLSRRLYPEAGSYRLGALAQWHALPSAGRAHRALADAQVAAHLLSCIRRDLGRRRALGGAPPALLLQLQRAQRQALPKVIERYRASGA